MDMDMDMMIRIKGREKTILLLKDKFSLDESLAKILVLNFPQA